MQTAISKIEQIIQEKKQVTAKELREILQVSQVLVHRHLKTLLQKGKIQKIGSSPKVFYLPSTFQKSPFEKKKKWGVIEKNWLEIEPNGRFLYGNAGFELWCEKRGFNLEERRLLFEKMFWEKEKLKNFALLDATEKITQTFQQNFLEKLWYIDFYSWEIFGKTVLGKLILYAKQNSDLVLMQQIAERIKDPLLNLLQQEKFEMVGLIPHSVQRKKDFLKTTLGFLKIIPKPVAIFEKIFADHAVAQKTLKSKQEREKNARETLFLREKEFPCKILLIDDACGSGATLNIAAEKIKKIAPQTQIYALTFVGSLKGFQVISET